MRPVTYSRMRLSATIRPGFRPSSNGSRRPAAGAPDLGVDALCRTFDISRASLYRHFPEPGGVARVIRERRLAAAREELTSRPATRRRVSRVAARWGFSDPGHFHRLFKRRYGASSSEIAWAPKAPEASLTPPELLGGWLRGLRPRTGAKGIEVGRDAGHRSLSR